LRYLIIRFVTKYKIVVNPYSVFMPLNFDNFLASFKESHLPGFKFGIRKTGSFTCYFFECDKVFENNLLSLISTNFPGVEIEPIKDNPNFKFRTHFGLKNLDVFPIKRYDQFEDRFLKTYLDPLDSFLHSTKGLSDFEFAIDIVTVNSSLRSRILKVYDYLLKFKFVSFQSFWFKFFIGKLGGFLLFFFPVLKESEVTKNHSEETSTEGAIDKINKNLFWTNIKFSYTNKSDLDSALVYLNKFNLPHANGFKLSKKPIRFLMSSEEIASVFHFPTSNECMEIVEKISHLKIPFVGSDKNCNELCLNSENDIPIYLAEADRNRHTYIIGKTGMGKSTLIKSMILQDLALGKGIGLVDPHGDLIEHILMNFPKNRTNDLVYVDPSDFANPICFNPLDVGDSYQRNLVADSLVEVFKKIFSHSWGPRLEYFLKNSFLLLAEIEGQTLLSLPRLFSEPDYLKSLLSKTENYFIKNFFETEFLALAEKQRQEIVSPILNKVGPLLIDPILRNIFASPKNKLDLAFLMNSNKIVLLNLSKGKIGSLNSSLLGAIFVSSFNSAALKRAQMLESERNNFYLYIDEFQNFATDSFAESLAEARKYKLNLILANQYLTQLPENLVDGVLGNVGNTIVFQIGFADAEKFYAQFAEKIPINCFVGIRRFSAYAQFVQNGTDSVLVSIKTIDTVNEYLAENQNKEKLIQSSLSRYNTKLSLVDKKLKKWILN